MVLRRRAQPKSRITVAGEIQNFGYDDRNRKNWEWWDGYPADAEWRYFGYDDANHLTRAANGLGATGTNIISDVIRTYDDAGRLTGDQQTVYVNGVPNTKNVNYPTYTDDGRVTRMYVNGASPAYDYTFSYDNMGRFEKIKYTPNGALLFQYHYDPASNEIQRDNLYNSVTQIYPRDELSRMTKVELQGASSAAREVYDYYTIGRLRNVTRQDNKQDQFVYYLDGELKRATYGVTATPPPSGTPAPPIATAATNVTSNGFSANWRSVAGATGYRLDVSTSPTFANYVPGYQNLNVGNVTSRAVSGLTGSTTYYYRVRAYNGNGTSGNSNVISVTTTTGGQVATPSFQPDGLDVEGCAYNYTFNVTISTSTAGAQIRWTIDGSTPSPTNGNLINGSSGVASFTISGFRTLQAMAYKTGMINSNIKSADFSFHRDCGPGPGYPLDNAGAPPAGPVEPDLAGTSTYTLDRAGNRTAVNGVNYSPNSINQYTSVGGSAVTNGPDHQISDYYAFHYTYMRDQELTRITAPSVPGFSYDLAHDALGRCVKRSVTANNNTTTTYYIYDGDKPILAYNAGNALVGFNVYGKGIDEILQRGAYGADHQWHWYFLNQDHEGSVTHLTDADGTIIEKYRYDVFGTPSFYNGGGVQISTTAYNNRFLFTGREYDGAWMYEYRARMYHSYLGRFMSEDPKLFDAGDYNLFRYCHNDPINHTDPMGLTSLHAMGHPTPERMKAMTDEAYNEGMANAQRTMHGAHGGAIGIGRAGYNAWSAQQATQSFHMAQVRASQQSKEYAKWGKGGAGEAGAKEDYGQFMAYRNSEGYAEYWGPIAQRKDAASGHYIALPPQRGSGVRGAFQISDITHIKDYIPEGYRLVGYHTSHVQFEHVPMRDVLTFQKAFGIPARISMMTPGMNHNYDRPVMHYYPLNGED